MDNRRTGTSKLSAFGARLLQSMTLSLAASAFRFNPQPLSKTIVIAILERVR
jgi:hypothetical protein